MYLLIVLLPLIGFFQKVESYDSILKLSTKAIFSPKERGFYSIFEGFGFEFLIIVELIAFLYFCRVFYKKLFLPFKEEWSKEELSIRYITKVIKFLILLNIVLSIVILFLITFSFSLSDHIDVVSALSKEIMLMALEKK